MYAVLGDELRQQQASDCREKFFKNNPPSAILAVPLYRSLQDILGDKSKMGQEHTLQLPHVTFAI